MKKTITLLLTVALAQSISSQNTTIDNAYGNLINEQSKIEATLLLSNDTVTTSAPTPTAKDANVDNSQSSYIIDGEDNSFTFLWKKRNHKKLSPHWSGFGMSFMNYNDTNIPHGTLKMSTSHNFTLNILSYEKQLGHSNWMLVTGLGFDWSRYHFDSNAALTKVNGITQFRPAPEGINYQSTKLLAYYITIPLMLEYQSGGFHIAAGAVCFFKYYSKSQIKYYDQNGKHTIDMGKDLNIRPIDLRLKAQIGVNNVSLFGYYAPTSMFEKNKGPNLKMYAIGAMLHF